MIAANFSNFRENLKSYCDRVTEQSETVIVTRKNEKNIVVISLDEWNALQKAAGNADYLAKLQRAVNDVNAGKTVIKTMKELEEMENE